MKQRYKGKLFIVQSAGGYMFTIGTIVTCVFEDGDFLKVTDGTIEQFVHKTRLMEVTDES
jgi:hypothetical protein